MGHIFQDECWEKYPSGDQLMCLWLWEIGKGNGNGFGKAKWHYLAFIYENNGN